MGFRIIRGATEKAVNGMVRHGCTRGVWKFMERPDNIQAVSRVAWEVPGGSESYLDGRGAIELAGDPGRIQLLCCCSRRTHSYRNSRGELG